MKRHRPVYTLYRLRKGARTWERVKLGDGRTYCRTMPEAEREAIRVAQEKDTVDVTIRRTEKP